MKREGSETTSGFFFVAGVPPEMTTDQRSKLSVSSARYKIGKKSLRWDFSQDSFLQLDHPISDQPGNTFSIWIYNEQPVADGLTFAFGNEERVDCHFNFRLNFWGWRTAWVAYDRDMQGQPQPDMNRLTIHAPKGMSAGTLYFDQIILSSAIDPRYHMRDAQVPFVNMETESKKRANRHWMSLYTFQALRPKMPVLKEVTQAEREAVALITDRYEKTLFQQKRLTPTRMDDIRRQFKEWGVAREGGSIHGPSVTYVHYDDIYPRDLKSYVQEHCRRVDVKDYTDFLLQVAVTYRQATNLTQRQELVDILMTLVAHLRDQGWAAGSGLGTLHHLGYNFQSYYEALFLMRDELERRHVLESVCEDMVWFSGVGRIFEDEAETGEGIIDIFNTTLHGMLACILLMANEAEQMIHMDQLREWIARYLRPSPGLMSCFKVDGSTFHHAGHYPAYAIGGFNGVAPVVYFLSGSPFQIPADAHGHLRHALLTMRLYCNKYEWLLSLSGRHPTGRGSLAIKPYKYMALVGSPAGTEKIDREVASAYLRLSTSDTRDAIDDFFRGMGVTEEPDPVGHWTMNYAALSLHRRNHWLVGARGHSRYLWGNESYSHANVYGRYMTYGHVQILSSGDPVNQRDSGFAHDGWDWNRWPGTTVIHLPLEELRSNINNVDDHSGFEEMLLSDETYAGGVNLQGENGLFAMKLSEHPKYNGSHRARKSVFFFDDRVILLGSNIENDVDKYPTETTLFQNSLRHPTESVWMSDRGKMNGFPSFDSHLLKESVWLIDNKENGYYIPAGQHLCLSRSRQSSRSQNKGELTSGDFVTSWLHHGEAPQGEHYEYAILVGTTPQNMQHFTDQMAEPETEVYRVLQKDKQAHIVHDRPTGITGYALFEANECLAHDIVRGNDKPCMMMTRLVDEGLTVSIVNPDLALYAGIDPDQYDEKGRRKEVSIYSRDWIANESQVSPVRLTLHGLWELRTKAKGCRIVLANKTKTIIECRLKDGLPLEVFLHKKRNSIGEAG